MIQIVARGLRLGFGLLLNVVYQVASLCPRDSALWVFGAWNGKNFLDNPKYVFLYTLHNVPDVRVVWITRCRELAQDLRERGFPAEYAGSLNGIWAQLRAGVVVFSHSVEWDLWAPLISRRVLRIQTWHGIPIKHIGYDNKNGTSARRAKLISYIYPYRDDRLDLVTSAGPADQSCYRTAFNVKPDAVAITGYPRNDVMFQSTRGGSGRTCSTKKAIYMPTLRGAAGSEFLLFETTCFDFNVIDNDCKKLGLHLWIKLHPVQKFREQDLIALGKCEYLHALTEGGDIYESIGEYDILITDFSGIYFDFLISGRPTILAPLDMAEYIAKDRSLYYEYKDLCYEDPCMSWKQVLQRLNTLCAHRTETPKGYRCLQGRFHKYLDSHSAQRVALMIMNLSLERRTIAVDFMK